MVGEHSVAKRALLIHQLSQTCLHEYEMADPLLLCSSCGALLALIEMKDVMHGHDKENDDGQDQDQFDGQLHRVPRFPTHSVSILCSRLWNWLAVHRQPSILPSVRKNSSQRIGSGPKTTEA
jgi:hypothetical protein